jgi:hypothetical protein
VSDPSGSQRSTPKRDWGLRASLKPDGQALAAYVTHRLGIDGLRSCPIWFVEHRLASLVPIATLPSCFRLDCGRRGVLGSSRLASGYARFGLTTARGASTATTALGESDHSGPYRERPRSVLSGSLFTTFAAAKKGVGCEFVADHGNFPADEYLRRQ